MNHLAAEKTIKNKRWHKKLSGYVMLGIAISSIVTASIIRDIAHGYLQKNEFGNRCNFCGICETRIQLVEVAIAAERGNFNSLLAPYIAAMQGKVPYKSKEFNDGKGHTLIAEKYNLVVNGINGKMFRLKYPPNNITFGYVLLFGDAEVSAVFIASEKQDEYNMRLNHNEIYLPKWVKN